MKKFVMRRGGPQFGSGELGGVGVPFSENIRTCSPVVKAKLTLVAAFRLKVGDLSSVTSEPPHHHTTIYFTIHANGIFCVSQ